jgi:hypothetical protein
MNLLNIRYGRTLRARLIGIGCSYAIADYLVKATKLIIYPTEFMVRKFWWVVLCIQTLDKSSIGNVNYSIRESYGYSRIDVSGLPIFEEIRMEAFNLMRAKETTVDLNDPKQAFRHNLLNEETFNSCPRTLEFATSLALIDAAASYLKTVPILTDVQIWWTPKNELFQGSQMLHIDQIDPMQFKVLVNLSEVEAGAGPFCFFDRLQSQIIKRNVLNAYVSLTDEEVSQHADMSQLISLEGPPGSAVVINSSQCYHFGGRSRQSDRLLLMIQFAPYHCIKEPADILWLRVLNAMEKKLYFGTDLESKIKKLVLATPPNPFYQSVGDTS